MLLDEEGWLSPDSDGLAGLESSGHLEKSIILLIFINNITSGTNPALLG